MVTANFPNPAYEMFVDGAWVPITSDMYVEGGTTYSRGRRSEGSTTDFGSATIHLKNTDGKYSNRNPSSPYFGKIGRNTLFRQSLQVDDHFLVVRRGTNDHSETPDHSSFNLTGDVDFRVEIAPEYWTGYSYGVTNTGWSIATQWSTPSQQGWYWSITADGCQRLGWSSTGSNVLTATSTEAVRAAPGARIVLRVTLDVNNGASGNTATFYTSTSMTGPWKQLGAPVVQTGTTSIFNSNTAPYVGNDAVTPVNNTQIERKIYRFEIRDGINGTIVCNPNWSAVIAGYWSVSDATSKLWTPSPDCLIVDRVYRFVAEGSEWSPRWGAGGKVVRTPVETSGVLRRLDQGAKPVESTLYKAFTNFSGVKPSAYWPLEDGKYSAQSNSPYPGVSPLTLTGLSGSSNDTCPASGPLPVIGGATSIFAPVPAAPNTGTWNFEMHCRMDSAPANNSTLFEFTTTAGSPWTIFRLQVSGSLLQMVAESGDGASTLVFATSNPANMFGAGWLRCTVGAFESGTDLLVYATWQVLSEMGLGNVESNSDFLANTTAGRINTINTKFGADLSGASFGHILVGGATWGTDGPWDNAYAGDIAGSRMMIQSAEKGVPFYGIGRLVDEEALGYQTPITYLDLMREAESADGGVLCEDRTQAGLFYRDRASMYTQIPVLTIPYGHLAAPTEPTDDDQRIRNETTVQRKDGSKGTVSLTSGKMSIQDPPNGVGLYDQSVTLNIKTDTRTTNIAGWLNHFGTWDEERYPKIRLLLHDHPEYIKDVVGLDTGSVIRITGTPPWLPPGPIDLMVEGYEETTRPHWWELVLICSPAGPWNVAVVNGDGNDVDEYARVVSTGSKVAMDANTTATSFVIETTQPVNRDSHALWSPVASHYPMLLRVGGEVVDVATAAVPFLNDDFTRSVGSGWGTATDGQAWSTSGGATGDRSVNGTQGVVTLNSTGTIRYQYLNAQQARDGDIYCVISCSAVATGATLAGGLLFRYAVGVSGYVLRVHFGTASTVFLSVTSNGTTIGTTDATGLSYSAGTQFNLRMRVVGNKVLGKIWPLTNGEPVEWMISRDVDSALAAAGMAGCMGHAFTGATNVAPAIRFDSLQVYNPQRLAGVTRSVNGVVKSHTGGSSEVQVYKPAVTAL